VIDINVVGHIAGMPTHDECELHAFPIGAVEVF
jgi:hypothetical protein